MNDEDLKELKYYNSMIYDEVSEYVKVLINLYEVGGSVISEDLESNLIAEMKHYLNMYKTEYEIVEEVIKHPDTIERRLEYIG